jgi:hypothetical protein
VRDKLIDVCTWSNGRYAWHASRKNPREAFPLDLDPYEVIGAGAMSLPIESLDAWVKKHGQVKLRSAKVPNVGPHSFRVPGTSVIDTYHALDGKKSLAQLRDRYTDDAEQLRFLRSAYLLFNTGLAKDAR